MYKNLTQGSLLSRRSFLTSAGATGLLFGLAPAFQAASKTAADPSALIYAGDNLLIGGEKLWRLDIDGTVVPISTPEWGNINALAVHNDRKHQRVAGLSQGGVILSEDGGQSWLQRNQGLPDLPVRAVAMAAIEPDTLYAVLEGDGLWTSEDAGQSWNFAMDRPWLGEAERELNSLVSVDLATGMGGIWLYAGTDVGLTRVPDCFCRWQDVQPGDAMDALVSGAPAAAENPLPAGEPIFALVSAPSLPSKLYAVLPSGIWSSEDAGVVWTQIADISAQALAVHPENTDQIAALNGGKLIQSHDGGLNWTTITTL